MFMFLTKIVKWFYLSAGPKMATSLATACV